MKDLFELLVRGLYLLNIVEWLKRIAVFLCPARYSKVDIAHRTIDWFVLFKWYLVTYFIIADVATKFALYVAIYLLVMNVYTYFYHHVWALPCSIDNERMKRRFVNLMLSFMFSGYVYSYIYAVHFKTEVVLAHANNPSLDYLLYSICNSLLVSYSGVSAIEWDTGVVVVTQYMITFVYLVFLFVNAISTNKE